MSSKPKPTGKTRTIRVRPRPRDPRLTEAEVLLRTLLVAYVQKWGQTLDLTLSVEQAESLLQHLHDAVRADRMLQLQLQVTSLVTPIVPGQPS